ncbi:MAG: hypothetical protein ACO1RX_12870 [Candidatus Sericytochromatia bacterium]
MKSPVFFALFSLSFVLSACQSQPLAAPTQQLQAQSNIISDLCRKTENIDLGTIGGRFLVSTDFKGTPQSGSLEVKVTLLNNPQTPAEAIQYTVAVGKQRSAPVAFLRPNHTHTISMKNVSPSERVALSYYAKIQHAVFQGHQTPMSDRICSD